jgi:hypothetical protein
MSFGGGPFGAGGFGGGGASADIVITITDDDVFGTTEISGSTDITPTVTPDESLGLSQVVNGPLWQFYGPLTTPLIADAPYSQVYS